MIIGFDPGLASTGWAVIDEEKQKVIASGVILTKASLPPLERLFDIRLAVRALLQAYYQLVPRPEVAIEDFVFQKRTTKRGHEVPLKSAEMLNRVVQLIVSECWALSYHVALYPASEVKEAIAGNSKAKKEEVKKGLILRLAHRPRNNHAIDAAAVALYHADLAIIRSQAQSAEIAKLMKR